MNLLLIGATSRIAQGVARAAAARGDSIFLVGRNPERLAAVAADLKVRGAKVETLAADLDDVARHGSIVDAAEKAIGPIDSALIAHGTLTDQEAAQKDGLLLAREIVTNFSSAASMSEQIASRFESRGKGVLAVITSVAGDRGRPTNYAYGAAKAGLIAYLSGLRARVFRSGVRVIDVRPGPVATPMTAALKQGPLMADPDAVGARIHAALSRPRDVLYVPWFWAHIMRIIRWLPAFVFKRLRL